MAVRYLVEDTFQIPGRGPVVAGLLLEGTVRNGDALVVEGTGTRVRVSFVDVHTRQTPAGLRVGLELHPEDAAAATPGSTLVTPPAG